MSEVKRYDVEMESWYLKDDAEGDYSIGYWKSKGFSSDPLYRKPDTGEEGK